MMHADSYGDEANACFCSLQYIQEIAGCRTVPVEVGSRYTDEDWSQTLMTVDEFIHKYILSEVYASYCLTDGQCDWNLTPLNLQAKFLSCTSHHDFFF